jgi:hypothetical protein
MMKRNVFAGFNRLRRIAHTHRLCAATSLWHRTNAPPDLQMKALNQTDKRLTRI